MAVKKKSKKKVLSAAEKQQRAEQSAHKRVVRGALGSLGFQRVAGFSDKELTFQGTTSDFDDLFIWKNIWVLTEYTTSSSGLSEHAKKKWFLYEKIISDQAAFIEDLCVNFAVVEAARDPQFPKEKIVIKFLYCSKKDVAQSLKDQLPKMHFFDYPIAMYFKAVAASVRYSGRPEFLHYLGVGYKEAGDQCLLTSGVPKIPFEGSVLPDAHSNLGKKLKVVSFYISPGALLDRAFVLRKDGWRDSDWLYQRMISPKKIAAIRSFLRRKQRVFLNNMIVTLPADTRIVDENDDPIDSSKISTTQPARVLLPQEFNSVGLIDGQHRIYSYHEGGKFDHDIAPLRNKLNLLVTGVLYPKGLSEADRTKFEAEIFLEINSTQTGASSEVKQVITTLLNPFDPDAIAKRVLTRLDRSGALERKFLSYFYDKERVKTTSVVSYGLRHLVNPQSAASLFHRWTHASKSVLLAGEDLELLQDYVDYCFMRTNEWFLALKKQIGDSRWTYDKKVADHALNATNVIGMINCFRAVVRNGDKLQLADFEKHLVGVEKFGFKSYKSSQYGAMGKAMYAKFYP
ncbi:MAG: hypothetical protein ABL962_07550 [Fimbriimonadaceae bacterium]